MNKFLDRTNKVEHEFLIEAIQPWRYDQCLREMRFAAYIGDMLAKEYPGYGWLVNVDFNGAVAMIECGEINSEVISHMTYKYVLHLTNLIDPSIARKKIIKAGGEMLERAYQPRSVWQGEYPTKVDGVADEHQPLAGRLAPLNPQILGMISANA